MALFNPCMEFEIFLGQKFFVQVLFQVDRLDKFDYLKNPLLDLVFCFVLSSYEFLAMLEGKI